MLHLLVLFPFGIVLLAVPWRLPESGHVAGLVTAVVGVVGEAVVGCAADEVSWVSVSGPGRQRI